MRNTKYIVVAILALLIGMIIGKSAHSEEISITRSSEESFSAPVTTGNAAPIEKNKLGKEMIIDNFVDDQATGSLTDDLKYVEGLRVKRIDGRSGLTTVRARGTRSIDTQLLFDGMSLRDASDPQGSANPIWGDLSSFGIGRIEVLEGPSSTVYGSAAQGAVVNVLPDMRKGTTIFSEYGTFNTFREGIHTGFDIGKSSSHELTFERTDSEGFDTHDRYGKTAVSGKSVFRIGDLIRLSAAWLHSATEAALQNSPFLSKGVIHTDSDDENDTRRYGLTHGHLALEIGDAEESVLYSGKVGYTDSWRRFTFLSNSNGSGFFSDGDFRGETARLENRLTTTRGDFTTSIGNVYEREWLSEGTFLDSDPFSPGPNLFEKHDQYQNDFYVEEVIDVKPFTLTFGARQNDPEVAKSRGTWDSSVAWALPEGTIARAHYGTAYRAPSLFERYGALLSSFGRFPVGNTLLSPERTTGWDIGLEHAFCVPDVTIGSTLFRTDTQNKIDYFGSGYKNIDGLDHADGVESYLEWSPVKTLALRGAWTHTQGKALIDTPSDAWSVTARLNTGKWHLGAGGAFLGPRTIAAFNTDDFTVGKTGEGSSFVVDAIASYDVTKNLNVYLRGENLLDEKYTEGGYRTPGTRIYGGARYAF